MSVPRRPVARLVLAALAGAAVTVALVVAPGAYPGAAAARVAPGAPGTASDWVPGDKDAFGTAQGTASKVWYTASRGTLNEVYYPRIDTPSLRDSQFVVTDGSTFTDREDRDATHQVQLLSPDSLTYRQVNTAKSGAWRITKTFVTDPARSSVLEDVRFESLTGKEYQVYLLHDVALSMTGNDDTGRSGAGAALLSSDGTNASAVVTSPALGKTSSGYLGTSDGWTDLATDHDMDWSYDATAPGNVVQTGRVKVNGLQNHQRFTVSIGFGSTETSALSTAQASLGAGFAAARTAYDAGLGRLSRRPSTRCRPRRRPGPPSGRSRRWSWPAARTRPSAAASSRPRPGPGPGRTRCSSWRSTTRSGPATSTRSPPGCSRSATTRRPNRALDYLWNVQQRPDGSFPQNSRLDGTPVFGDLQMDEVAFPIVLAHQLGRTGPADWDNVKLSADSSWPRTARGPRRSGGRTSPASRRRPSPPRSPAWSAPPTSRRRTATTARPRPTWRRPTSGSRRSSRWTATTTGPYSTDALLPAGHQERRPRLRRPDADLRRRPADRRAATSSTPASSTWSGSASSGPTTR